MVMRACGGFSAGLFVMVTMVLSTVSVIASVFVVRVHNSGTRLPDCVRAVAFCCLARILCISVPSRSKLAAEDEHEDTNATENHLAADGVTWSQPINHGNHLLPRVNSAVDDANQSGIACRQCLQLNPQVDSLLYELRKVFLFISFYFLYLFIRQWQQT